MADYGLLNGLAEGLKSGVSSYRDTKEQMSKERERAEDKALRDRMLQLQMAQAGVEVGEDGSLSETAKKKREGAFKEANDQAGLLKSGYQAEYDEATGKANLKAIPGFKDIEKENQVLNNRKLHKELGLKDLETQAKTIELRDGKKPTDTEKTASGFAKRLEQAENVFKSVEKSGYDSTSMKSAAQRKIPGFLGGMKPKELQLQEQAERNFVNAVLRKESGAAISPTEFKSAEAQYFPRPGDAPEVLHQKALNRKIVFETLKSSSGRAYDQMPSVETMAAGLIPKEPTGLINEAVAAEPAQKMPKVGYVEAGFEYVGGDPADQKSWRKAQ